MEYAELKLLEEKIELLLSLIDRLKAEREDLVTKLKKVEAENLHLQEEINHLVEEKKEIRGRIYRIIEKIEHREKLFESKEEL